MHILYIGIYIQYNYILYIHIHIYYTCTVYECSVFIFKKQAEIVMKDGFQPFRLKFELIIKIKAFFLLFIVLLQFYLCYVDPHQV